MKADLIIRGGTLIDARQKISGICDVAVSSGKIMAVGDCSGVEADTVIDAEGCIVSPGLIDNHLHMFADGSDAGIDPNTALLPSGVTSAVEGGTPGPSTFELYNKDVIERSRVNVVAYMSAASTGMVTRKYPENFDPQYFDAPRIKELFRKYPDKLVGLKIRYSRSIIDDMDKKPMEAVIAIAEEIGCPITVHITDPAIDIEELAGMLRPGDVFCHAFQGKGQTIIGEDGKVRPGIIEAKQRGVIIDACNGKFNFSFAVAEAALADRFYPDIISTDYNTMVMFCHPVISLPYLMSKYLMLGMSLEAVFAACTEAPAKAAGISDKAGSLIPGMPADISVFKLVDQPSVFYDCHGENRTGSQVLAPQLTVKDGRIMYREISFTNELR